jgi:hypothetical protein
MQRPKINKLYLFVRVVNDHIEHAEFVRYEDGSASYVVEGRLDGVEEPDAWKLVTNWFESNGFIESREAKAKGLIPEDWEPEKIIMADLL